MQTVGTRARMGRRGWIVVALLAAGAMLLLAVLPRAKHAPAVPSLGGETVTIVPGVHMLGGLGPSAAYAVETTAGLVLVDSGLQTNAGTLVAQMDKVGVDWRNVVAFLLTHAHGDHVGGARNLSKATGAKVYAGAQDAGVVRAGGPREAFFSTFAMSGYEPHATPVDVGLQGGERLPFGDTTFEAVALPGHTPGSMGYLMEKNGLRVLFAGDVITMLVGEPNPHFLGLRPLGTYSAYLAPRYRGDVATSLASLRKLRAMPVPDLVLPGHPASDPTPQSPRLSQERWEEILDQGIRDLETLRDRYRADGGDFLDDHPKTLLPGLVYLGDFRGGAVYLLTTAHETFVVNAPGGAGLADFVAKQKGQAAPEAPPPSAVLLSSCEPSALLGLPDLVETFGAKVVAPRGGIAAAKSASPPGAKIEAAEDLASRGDLAAKVVPLGGRGLAPVAYLLAIEGKNVLISGRLPVLFDEASTASLADDIGSSRETTMGYLLAINTLEGLEPDLWLPSVPSDGQNANLYDGDWHYIIVNNYRLGRSILNRPR